MLTPPAKRIFFGKTKLMAKALGQTPAEAQADGIERLTRHLAGQVGLLFTNRDPEEITTYFANLTSIDYARAGTVSPRAFTIPHGHIHSRAGEIPVEHDLPLEHSIEPELRRLGVPTILKKGKIVLGDEEGGGPGYLVCKEGDVLDSRQTRLLKMFGVCLSEFKVKVVA